MLASLPGVLAPLPTGNHGSALNGAITLPNAKTETNKMGIDPIGNLCVCLSVLYERLHRNVQKPF